MSEAARVVKEQRTVYRVPGGCSRFTKPAAYREAARVAIRNACTCEGGGDGWNEPPWFDRCRFHGEAVDGFAFDHPSIDRGPICDREGQPVDGSWHGEAPDGDGGRHYYVLVRERLARWLRWADGVRDE